ncbi:MAG: S8 family serine peptidase [bacterium]|nr:S8 family serine peptidase [bacterium]
MKRIFLLVCLGVAFSVSDYAQSEMVEKAEFVPGEFLLSFKDGVDERENMSIQEGIVVTEVPSVDKLNKQFRVKSMEPIFPQVYKSYGFPSIYKVKLPEDTDILTAIKNYQRDPNIEHAEPNWIFHTCITPDDEYFEYQWGVRKIDAPKAWDVHTGTENVVIAIVDTGIDYDHPDIAGNIWINEDEIPNNRIDDDHNGHIDDRIGWDWDDGDNDPADENGHGTHVSGIAGAVTNNTIGIAGTSWKCKLMAVRGLNERGKGRYDALIGGIAYACVNGAKVINMSWGQYLRAMPDWAIIYMTRILKIAYEEYGCVMPAAAGNDNIDMDRAPRWGLFPGVSGFCIGVAATNIYDQKADYSNYGSKVDVSAPGVIIYSTMPTYHVTMNDEGYNMNYDYLQGTSMATPFVSGLAGLLLSQHPEWTNLEVISRIENTADPIDYLNPGYEGKLGKGRINVAKALTSKTSFTDEKGNNVKSYYIGLDNIFVTTIDHSEIGSLEVKVSDSATGDMETLILEEIYSKEGYFRNTRGLTSSLTPTGIPENGNLETLDGNLILASYTDSDDPVDTSTSTVSMVKKEITIDDILKEIDNYLSNGSIDNDGVGNSLKVKLNKAKAKIEAGQTNTAINILNAFINEVSAQKGKHITSETADSLISNVNSIIESFKK